MKQVRLAGTLGLLIGLAGIVHGAGSPKRQIQRPPQPQPQPQLQSQSQQPRVPVQSQQQMINLSLVDALVAVHEESLAGIFGYIAEPNAAPAFAEYLFKSPKALKLFVQKGERDLKAAGGISQWDKEVFLFIVGINSSGTFTGAEALSTKMLDRISTLSLVTGLPLSEITMRRKH